MLQCKNRDSAFGGDISVAERITNFSDRAIRRNRIIFGKLDNLSLGTKDFLFVL